MASGAPTEERKRRLRPTGEPEREAPKHAVNAQFVVLSPPSLAGPPAGAAWVASSGARFPAVRRRRRPPGRARVRRAERVRPPGRRRRAGPDAGRPGPHVGDGGDRVRPLPAPGRPAGRRRGRPGGGDGTLRRRAGDLPLADEALDLAG